MFKLDTEINVLALTSFVLSLFALLSQFSSFLIGSRVELHAPRTVVIRLSKPANSEDPELHFELPMAYSNSGSKDYAAIIHAEEFKLTYLNENRQFRSFVNFDSTEAPKAGWKESPVYKGERPSGAHVVPGAGSTSHWALFIPLAKHCKPGDTSACKPAPNAMFVTPTLEGLQAFFRDKTFEVEVSAATAGDKKSAAKCEFLGAHVADLAGHMLEKGFASVNCFSQVRTK
jgi:hypothetical protein